MIHTAARVKVLVILLGLCFLPHLCSGQGLSPRAYIITPIHSNAVTVTYTLNDGNIVFDPTLPVDNASGRIGTEIFTYVHAMSIFGRSANVNASLPYSIGHFKGDINGTEEKLYRSGLGATVVRASVNLFGASAMTPQEYMKWHQKTLIGVSLTVSTQTGQYDPARLVNIADNRWSFKPEVGLSRRWGNWVADVYGGVWFFTPNTDFFSNAPGSVGPNRQTQEAMGSTEAHLSYDVKPRLWISLDGNYWYGGRTSLNGVLKTTSLQANSRLGGTAAIPFGKHQALKLSYNTGTYIRIGGDYQTVSVAWQYSWLGRPQ